ncbi:MAG: hypothetical protein KIB00_09585 [Paeniclostridium sordellii]|nr:hypothetical protein [Paeniclostridium sordellii]
MLSRHPEHKDSIKGKVSDVRYEISSLIKLLDNEPISEVNRALYLKCTHSVIDSLQGLLEDLLVKINK